MNNGNFDELIDLIKARPAGTASGPLDKNKYVSKKVPVQRNGKTVLVTKYFDPSSSSAGGDSKSSDKGGDSKSSGSSSDANAPKPAPKKPQYATGDLVKIISDQIGAVVQSSSKDKSGNFVLKVITEKGGDIEVRESDVEKVTSTVEIEKITKESIINKLKLECDSINDDTTFAERKKVLKDCLKCAKNGITNVLVYSTSSVGKNKTILSILSNSGVRKNSKDQILDKSLSLSELDLSKIKDEDDLKEFLENNSKSLILVKDSSNQLPTYKTIFKDAIDRTLISIDFNGYFIFSVDTDLSGVPDEIKSVCLCVDFNMNDEIKKSFLLVEIANIDCTDDFDKFEIIKSFFHVEENSIEKSSQLPDDCILMDVDDFEQFSGKEIINSPFEEIMIGDRKIFKIKMV